MDILGVYNSQLAAFYYQQLLGLYQSDVSAGAAAGGPTSSGIAALEAQSTDFASLPVPSAGQVATDDSFNNPVTLLTARSQAISSEIDSFTTNMASYTSLIEKEVKLLDTLLAGADLEIYSNSTTTILGSQVNQWDFRIGPGLIDNTIATSDPSTSAVYTGIVDTYISFLLDSGITIGGLQPSRPTSVIPIKDISWIYSTAGQSEDLYGTDWASLSILEDYPRISFSPNPQVSILLPSNGNYTGIFSITGNTTGGTLPVYVQTSFTTRRNSTVLNFVNSCPDPLFNQGLWTLNSWVLAEIDSQVGASSVPGVGLLTSAAIPVQSDWQLYVRANTQNTTGTDGFIQINVSFTDDAGNQIALIPVRSVNPIVGSQIMAGIVTVPDNPAITKAFIQVALTNNTVGVWYIYDFLVQLPQTLSNYQISPDNVSVYTLSAAGTPVIVYSANVDFVIDGAGQVTFMELLGTSYGVRFTENYPSYTCSIDGLTWSPNIMLDPQRIYPDTTTVFIPVNLGIDNTGARTLFPITDELGTPLGLYLQLVGIPQYDYELLVSSPAAPSYGIPATLQVDLDKTAYVDSLYLSPLNAYPVHITGIRVEGLTSESISSLFLGDLILDRPMELSFDSQIVRTVYIDILQTNYSLKTHTVEPPDQLRRDILTQLQSVLPFSSRRVIPSTPTYYSGAQYDYGFESIQAYSSTSSLPQVIVAGPYRFTGIIDLLRINVEIYGSVSCYICYKTYSPLGVLLDSENVGLAVSNQETLIFPYAGSIKSGVGYVDVSMKYVLRTRNSSVGVQDLQAVMVNA